MIPTHMILQDSWSFSLPNSLACISEIKTAKRKRVQWSQDEMEFLREGVKMFGVGNWSKIRDRYPFQNCHKNSVAIKDKYRTMVKRGEIVE